MGFPVGYTEVYLLHLLIHVLTILGMIRRIISVIFRFVGLGDFLDPQFSAEPEQTELGSSYLPNSVSSASTLMIRYLIPVIKYSELVDPPDNCAVCLYEFEGTDEIRRLTNCRHVFHKCCLDRWMDHDQKTCPLCRTSFVPEGLKDEFNEQLWKLPASGITTASCRWLVGS